MPVRLKWVLGLSAGLLSCAAFAGDALDRRPLRADEHRKLYQTLFFAARVGDAEQQERFADFLLGPHGRKVKSLPFEGTQFLFRAAVGGRPTAMRHLAEALSKGGIGLRKRPAAAACWSAAPAGFEQRLACVRLTEFRDARARPSCADLVLMGSDADSVKKNGSAMAALCLANRTPAIMVPGMPPLEPTLYRTSEYKRHGIEWVVTGDVYRDDAEKFREAFNRAVFSAVDGERGQGYLDRLSNDIEVRTNAKYAKSSNGDPR